MTAGSGRAAAGVFRSAGAGLRPRIGAHRGDLEVAPENTLAAFEAAAIAGVDYIEIDVQWTSDRALVVIHDDRLDRTTAGQGQVANLPLAAVRELDAGAWFDTAFRGERVPTLDDSLEWLVHTPDVGLLVEAKAPGTGREIGRRLARVPFPERVGICSFTVDELRDAAAVNPDLPRILIAPRRPCRGLDLLASAHACRATGLNVSWSDLDRALVLRLHADGLLVTAGTANDRPAMARVIEVGADLVDSDRPKMALAVRDASRAHAGA